MHAVRVLAQTQRVAAHAFEQIGDGHRVPRRFSRGVLDARQLQQIFDDEGHAVRLLGHLLQGTLPALGSLLVVGERLQVPDDDGQRAAQLVRHIGDKVLPDLLQAVQPSDIAGQHQAPSAAVGHDAHQAMRAVVDRRRHLQRLLEALALEVVDEVWIPDEVRDRLIEILGVVQAEQFVGGLVQPYDSAVDIQNHRGVGKSGGGLLEAADEGAQTALALAGSAGSGVPVRRAPAPRPRAPRAAAAASGAQAIAATRRADAGANRGRRAPR